MRKRFVVLILLMLTAISIAGTTYANPGVISNHGNDFEQIGERVYLLNPETGEIDFHNFMSTALHFGIYGASIKEFENYDQEKNYRVVIYNYLTNEIFFDIEALITTFWDSGIAEIEVGFWNDMMVDEGPMLVSVFPTRNIRIFWIDVEATEDLAPVISGVTTIAKSTDSILTIAEIKAMLSATDDLDGNITSSIEVRTDNFTGNGNVVGQHSITFEVTDTNNNTTSHVVTVNVIDGLPAIIHVLDDNKIVLDTSMFLEPLEIIQVLEAIGTLEIDGTANVVFTTNEYESNEAIVGTYDIAIDYTSSTGAAESFELTIEVIEEQEATITIEDTGIIGDIIDFYEDNTSLVIGVLVFGLLIGFISYKFPVKKKRRRK